MILDPADKNNSKKRSLKTALTQISSRNKEARGKKERKM